MRAAALRSGPPAIADFVVEERPEPGYVRLLRSGELARRARAALAELAVCAVCPRDCGVDRLHAVPADDPVGPPRAETSRRTVPAHIPKGTACFTGRYARVASAFPHFGEEDCLRGWNGSGTIFFSFCNLRCVFCQNWELSQVGKGREMRPEELAESMLELQSRGCHNINFVTPAHVVPQLLEALLVRHLVMPGALDDAREIFRFLATEVSADTYVDVMDQYHPAGAVDGDKYPELCRRPDASERLGARQVAEREGLWRVDTRWRRRGGGRGMGAG